MNQCRIISKEELDLLTNKRDGEIKLGETVQTLHKDNWQQTLKASKAPFVLLGISEDIGVRANYGVGGTQSLWQPALKAILNVQNTTLLQGENIIVLGAFQFDDLMQQSAKMNAHDLRELINLIDDAVFPVIKLIVEANKIPIIIGGGHNNAYPIIKGISRAKNKAINCINLDAHCDYRAIEGRHSGNGFRYAKMDGYLKKYAVVGLHENYNSQSLLNEMISDKDLHFSFYEDIFLHEKIDFRQAIDEAIHFTGGEATGIELDLDCIENILSSAATPCGITTLQARKFLITAAQFTETAYLHITEGAVRLEDGRENKMTAKLVSYLITDFIRACTNKPTIFIRESEM